MALMYGYHDDAHAIFCRYQRGYKVDDVYVIEAKTEAGDIIIAPAVMFKCLNV